MNALRIISILFIVCFLSSAIQAAQQVSFISERKVDNPSYVAVDPMGDFYVSGRTGSMYLPTGNGFIHVYNREGKKILAIEGQDKNGDPYLKKPAGIALYGNYIYVCDKSLDKVIIFTKAGAYVDSFGESGSAAKHFRNPEGIFVYQGNIYVADTDNNRIQVFGPNGVYLRSIGNAGPEEAMLKNPMAVAVDARGMIYAIDGVARLVKMYGQDGSYIGKLPGTANPVALAIGDDGLLVTDAENYNISKYNFSGEKLFSFGTMGKGNVQFQEPGGIAVDGRGNVYAIDRKRSSVQIISVEKGMGLDVPLVVSPPTSVKWIWDIPLKVRKLAWDKSSRRLYAVDDEQHVLYKIKDTAVEKTIRLPEAHPFSLDIDAKGDVWIIDRKASQLLKTDTQGRILQKVGASGSRDGYFSSPSDVLVGRDSLIYVADTGNNRVQVFNAEGVFLNAFTKAAGNLEMNAPVALDQDYKGNLYVVCEDRKVVLCLTASGNVIREIGSDLPEKDKFDTPVDVVVNGSEIMVLDAGTKSIKVFSLTGKWLREFGAPGNGKGDFKHPASLALGDRAHVVVSDPGNAKIQLFNLAYTPAAPGGIIAKADMRLVELVWQASEESFVESYRIFCRLEGEPLFTEVGTSSEPAYRDATVLPDKKYAYRISAKSFTGNEMISAETVSAVPLKFTPQAPVDLKAQSQEWSVDLSWKMNNPNHIDHYKIYREREGDALLAQPKTTSFSEGGLESNTLYSYLISAVSVDGIESDPASISIRTAVATKTPLEIDIQEMKDIFSNTYKIYETEGIGKVRLTNNTRDPIASLKLTFYIKEYMDFPTEMEIKDLRPKESKEIIYKAVFNNRVLDVTEDTPVQAELAVSYFENQKIRSYSKSNTVKLYEKHRMTWVTKDRIATFVTPKDPVILEFTRSVVTQYADIGSPLVYAAAIYNYMGQMGMTYLKHPTNPYQVVEGKTSIVDYVQFPRDTLKRNSGVCTDLVVLYAAALEGLGIRTLILGTPDHLFIMFAAGQVSELGDSTMNNMFVIHEDTIWVPVELTLVGSHFMKAWEKGSKTYYEWKKKGIEITDLTKAWKQFKPATLAASDWRAGVAARTDVDKRYGDELAKLSKIWLKYTSNRYYVALASDPKNANAYLQLGIVYGEAGDVEKAQSFLEKADNLMPNHAEIKNNIGNLFYLKGKYDEARKYYEKASDLDPSDPYILVNLSMSYLKLNKREKAAQALRRAVEKDAEIAKKYRTLAIDLL